MEVNIRIIGDDLYASLIKQKDQLNATFRKMLRHRETVEVQLEHLPGGLRPEYLILYPDAPSFLIISADNASILEQIQVMERRELMGIESPPCIPLVLCPVMLVFPSQSHLADVREFPEFISDWIAAPVQVTELARRMISALKRKNILKSVLHFGEVTLEPETRIISFQDKTLRLTRSEFALAEMFLTQMGAVIPLTDLIRLFKATGKSTEGSNIRVTIFQLRLKLEMLTRTTFTLCSVYRQGYCLKHKLPAAQASGRQFGDQRNGRVLMTVD